MGIVRRERKERQESEEPAPNVWIQDPKGSGQHILVSADDLDEQGFLKEIEEDKENGVS